MVSDLVKSIILFFSGVSFAFAAATVLIMPAQDMMRWIQRNDSIEERLDLVFSTPADREQKTYAERAKLLSALSNCSHRLDKANEAHQTLQQQLVNVTADRDNLSSNPAQACAAEPSKRDKPFSFSEEKFAISYPNRHVVENVGQFDLTNAFSASFMGYGRHFVCEVTYKTDTESSWYQLNNAGRRKGRISTSSGDYDLILLDVNPQTSDLSRENATCNFMIRQQ